MRSKDEKMIQKLFGENPMGSRFIFIYITCNT